MLTPALKEVRTASRKQNSSSATPMPRTVSSVRKGLRRRFSRRSRTASDSSLQHVDVASQHPFFEVELAMGHGLPPWGRG